MQVRHALERIDHIHEQLARSEVYRGFRVPAVASIGIVAIAAAAMQPAIAAAMPEVGFIGYWLAVATAGALTGTFAAVHRYFTREDDFARRRTRRVMTQFAPCIVVGGVITAAAARLPAATAFLPGLWAMTFGLGLIAAKPYLPSGIGLVGLGYVVAGAAMILQTMPNDEPAGWAVGVVFGVGHLATAGVLWRDAAREADDGI